jgi:hypothetical protein
MENTNVTENVETKVTFVDRVKTFVKSTPGKVTAGCLGVAALVAVALGVKAAVDAGADDEFYQPDDVIEVTDEDIMEIVE